MTIDSFAANHRLHTHRDECGYTVIPGRRGHLYFDNGALCLMVLDGVPANASRWQALGGKLWMGDISPDSKGKRVQDVKITGIPLENAKAAIRMVRIKPRRVLSSAQARQAMGNLARIRAKSGAGPSQSPESVAGG